MVVYLTSYIIYVAEMTLYLWAFSSLYSKKHIQCPCSFLDHFCLCSKAILLYPVSSDMWKLQILKENNDHIKFYFLYPLTLKDDYRTNLKVWKFRNHGLTYVYFILYSRMAIWSTILFSFLTTQSTLATTSDMAYCSVFVEGKSDLLLRKKIWYGLAFLSLGKRIVANSFRCVSGLSLGLRIFFTWWKQLQCLILLGLLK